MTTFSRGEKDSCDEKEEIDPPHLEKYDLVDDYYRRSRHKIRSWVHGKYGSSVDADDVTQDTFKAVHEYQKRFEKADDKMAYLLTVADNKAKTSLIKMRNERERERVFETNRQDDSGLQLYEGWQPEDIIAVAKKTLSDREMVYFRKVCLDRECTLSELAEQWNYTCGYIKQYAFRVRSKLRKALQKELQEKELQAKD